MSSSELISQPSYAHHQCAVFEIKTLSCQLWGQKVARLLRLKYSEILPNYLLTSNIMPQRSAGLLLDQVSGRIASKGTTFHTH